MLSYAPHNGFADQMYQLELARALANHTGRALVLPPLLRHFDAYVMQANHKLGWLRLHRPSVAEFLDSSALRVPIVDHGHQMRKLPPCDNGTLPGGRGRWPLCVSQVEPPISTSQMEAILDGGPRTHEPALLHFRTSVTRV